ncbi:hypothetical protein HMPREF1624_04631 [Sporothrix schenckii ATCC 58251]|uniref:Acyltransferase 3 domain-containing protein n=1 Tax=Sporothrix schenckii (strain ATCC 58251 / de Perez 2211183) TaxID=1391915 RepID=U7PWZ3_SPOS1|nr:hypothetical protein HMPREF1624_04631 [Sporothrix schenckii ATCC 58251]
MNVTSYDTTRARANEDGGRASRVGVRPPGANDSNQHDYHGTKQRTSQGFSSSNRQECKDKDCRKPVAWRNVDSIGGIAPDISGHNASSHNSSNMGSTIVPLHANQEAREVQMKLYDILSATGLPQADLPVLGNRPLAFATLQPGPASSSTPQQSPLQGSVAWMCAQFNAERDRREWYYRQRRSHLPRIVSDFCEDHTCRYFFTTEFCSTKKPRHDAMCNTHAFCPAFRCHEVKGQVADLSHSEGNVSKFLRHEFCPKHKCEVDKCELLCDETKPNTLGKFCPRHKCYYTGCVKQALDGRGYCGEHGCRSTNCQKIAVVGYMLCKKHLECAERSCVRPRFLVPTDRVLDPKDVAECSIERYDRDHYLTYYLAYCKDHGICADKSCSSFRISSSVHCRKHACLEHGCRKPCRTGLKYCEAHECEIETCVAKVAEDGGCIQHFKDKHKRQTKAAVRRDTEDTKIAVQRETQQWASTFGVSVGVGSGAGNLYADQPTRRPLRYFPTSNFSMSNRSAGSRLGGSPPHRWHGDHDFDDGWGDEQDYDGDRFRPEGRRRLNEGSKGNFRMHTPSSSDAGRSRYHDNNDLDDNSPSSQGMPKQLPPTMTSATGHPGPQNRPMQQQRQQHQQQPSMPGILYAADATWAGQLHSWAQTYAGRIAWPWAWDRDLRPGYDIHLWTIPIESAHAMLLFVVLLALAPLRTQVRQVLTGVLAGYCLACGRWAAFEFLAGFALAEVHVLRAATAMAGDHRSTTLSHLAAGAFHSTVLAACLFVAGWPNEDADKTPGIRALLSNTPAWFLSNGRDEALTEREDWGEALLEQKFWFGLAAVLLVWSCGEFAAARRQFERPLAQYCGRISYAVYLVHGPALDYWKDMTDRLVKPIGMETAVRRMTTWLVGLLFLGSVVVWLADLFWRQVDAPIVALGRAVEQFCQVLLVA